MDLALQAVCTGTGKGNWEAGERPSWNIWRYTGGKGGGNASRGGNSSWQTVNGKKGGKGTEKGGKGVDGHIAASCPEGGDKNLYAMGGKGSEELQAWCLLEKSEHGQWQQVISGRGKNKVAIVMDVLLLSLENNKNSILQTKAAGKDEDFAVKQLFFTNIPKYVSEIFLWTVTS